MMYILRGKIKKAKLTKEEHIEYWIKTAEHDLDAMQGIFDAGKYDWDLFVRHLVLEKILKALWVKDNEDNVPPKIHDLVRLANESKLNLSDIEKEFLLEVNDFNLEVRYLDYRLDFHKKCTKEFQKNISQKLKSIIMYSKKDLDNLITQLLNLITAEISIKGVYLFGSYAKGNAHKYSDIDLALVSDNFEGSRFFDKKRINEFLVKTTTDFEIHPYKTEESTEDDPFVAEILRTGIKII